MKTIKERLKDQLSAAHFRVLNEQLYTRRGQDSLKLMKQDPNLFDIYHEGFRNQVKQWPQNPLMEIQLRIKERIQKMEVIADMGCGEAALAHYFCPLGYVVHSFDLVTKEPYIKAADMTCVPIDDESVDYVVFCLSLMGLDWGMALFEGSRILKMNGTMFVSDVKSRVDLNQMQRNLKQMGFEILKKNIKNKMFFSFELKKTKKAELSVAKQFKPLKACVYKKR